MTDSAIDPSISSQYFQVAGDADEASRVSPFFLRRNLDHLQRDDYLSPQIVQKLAHALQRNHFRILGGRLDGAITHLLPHIAWALRQQILITNAADPKRLSFLEYQPQSESAYFNLATEIDKLSEQYIVIIPAATRRSIGWTFSEVNNAALIRGHYIICSSDIAQHEWHFDKTELAYWLDLKDEPLFTPDYLVDVLCRSLSLQQNHLPEQLRHRTDPQHFLFAQKTIAEIAHELASDRAITVFVQLLSATKKPTDAEIAGLIPIAASVDDAGIRQWYYSSLSRREQLQALALSFFDGLAEDQVFAALRELVLTKWQQQSADLSIFDYVELEKVWAFYRYSNDDASRARITSTIPNQRQILLKFAWDSYRMHIQSALSWMVELVKESVRVPRSAPVRPERQAGAARRSGAPTRQETRSGEIYGSAQQRKALRDTIGAVIGDIGLIAIERTQDALLWLVADDKLEIQLVVAHIIARWYAAGKRDAIFQVLLNWRSSRSRVFIQRVMQDWGNKKHVDIDSYIRSATILAATYAAKHDQPNQTDQRIVDLLEQLTKQPDVHNCKVIGEYMIPGIMPLHIDQIDHVLHHLLAYEPLHPSMSETLVAMYRHNERQVINVLHRWKTVSSQPSHLFSRQQRYVTLAFIARTLVVLWRQNTTNDTQQANIQQHLTRMVAQEQIALVHSAIVHAALHEALTADEFKRIEPLLLQVIESLHKDEHEAMTNLLLTIYRDQRKGLSGGDATFIHPDGQYYKAWVDSRRPSVFLEKVLFRWVMSTAHVPSQELALRASVAIAFSFEVAERKFQLEEFHRRRAERYGQEDFQQKQQAKIARLLQRPPFQPWSLVYWLVRGFDQLLYRGAVIAAPLFRPAIRSLLPETQIQYRRFQREVRFLVEKWRLVVDFKDLPVFAKEFSRAIWVIARRRIFAGLVLFLASILAVFLGLLIIRWSG